MPIEFRCPNCNQLLRTPDESAGKQARCPQCHQVTPVPASSSAAAAADFSAPPPKDLYSPPPRNPFSEANVAPPKKPAEAESFNPYASPTAFEATPAAAALGGELTHQTVEMGEVMGAPWRVLTEELGKCVAVGAIIMGVGIALRVVGQILQMIFQALVSTESTAAIVLGFLLLLVMFAVSLVVQLWVQAGLVLFSLKMARNRSGMINDLLAVGPFLLRYFGVWLIIALYTFAALLVCLVLFVSIGAGVGYLIDAAEGAGMGAAGGAMVAVLAAAVAAMVILYTYFLASYFVVDRDEGVFDALRSSAHFMRGNRLTAFGALLLAGLISLPFLCITCTIGQIFTIPYFGMLTAFVYLMATGQPHAGAAPTPFSQPASQEPFKQA